MALKKIEFKDGRENPVKAEQLNTMQDNIEEAINEGGGGILTGSIVAWNGDTIPEGYEEVDNPNSYSLTEKQIGYWIDGKPLYRKVVSCGALPNNSTLRVPIERTMKIIKVEGFATNENYTMPIPNPHATSSSVINIFVDYGLYEIGIETHSDRSAYTETYLTIEYIKTTD